MTTNRMGLEQSTLSDERLELFIRQPLDNGLTRGEQMELVREALARRNASNEPVAHTSEFYMRELDKSGLVQCWLRADASDPDFSVELFTAPQLQAIPTGWKLVPVEPTENMVVEGFESEPDSFSSDSDDGRPTKL